MFTLNDLGITKEELTEKVIQAAVNDLFSTGSVDDEGREYHRESDFRREINEVVKKTIEAGMRKYGEEVIVPKVDQLIRETVFQKTNDWGEKKGAPIPMHEFMVKMCETFLKEDVDSEGRSKVERNDYNWRSVGSRINWLVSKHLNKEIASGVEACMKNATTQFSKSVEESAKIALKQISDKLKIEVQMPR